MSDNKREQERTELYRTIWALANELRGSVDGWDFKQYVFFISLPPIVTITLSSLRSIIKTTGQNYILEFKFY